MEVLSDYIVALIENGINTGDLPCQLQDFLHDETETFICELNEYIEGSKNDLKDSEVEVDYEDDGEGDERVTTTELRPPQRVLREYSPERRDQSIVAPKDPNQSRSTCTNFIKRGQCRFGENCRYAHIQRFNPSNSIPSRIKLSNLPITLLNPTDLTKVMSKYGNVTGATVYPEKGEASVQFSKGEEAQKAFNDFEYHEEGIIIELDKAKKDHDNSFKNNRNPTTPSTNDLKLQSLLNLQKRQQSILESNFTVQKSLLTTLQNPSLTETERLESLSTLKSIQESVMGVQEMLKKTTELVIESAKSVERTDRQRYSNRQAQTYPPYQKPLRSQKPQHSQYKYAASAPNAHSLDLRPTTLKLTPLPAAKLTDIHSLQRHFSPYGLIQSLIITEQGQSAVIKYQKHSDAARALENASKSFDKDTVEFSFIK